MNPILGTLCIDQAGEMGDGTLAFLELANMFFLMLFTAEFFIKCIVLTPGGYFSDGWVIRVPVTNH